jgi:hypothetical protein
MGSRNIPGFKITNWDLLSVGFSVKLLVEFDKINYGLMTLCNSQ